MISEKYVQISKLILFVISINRFACLRASVFSRIPCTHFIYALSGSHGCLIHGVPSGRFHIHRAGRQGLARQILHSMRAESNVSSIRCIKLHSRTSRTILYNLTSISQEMCSRKSHKSFVWTHWVKPGKIYSAWLCPKGAMNLQFTRATPRLKQIRIIHTDTCKSCSSPCPAQGGVIRKLWLFSGSGFWIGSMTICNICNCILIW